MLENLPQSKHSVQTGKLPHRSHGLIPITERKCYAKPRPRTVPLCIHNETTHEADRPAYRIDGVRLVRLAALREHQTSLRRPLLPWRLAVFIGCLSHQATLSGRSSLTLNGESWSSPLNFTPPVEPRWGGFAL
jgi:hypothetical protein